MEYTHALIDAKNNIVQNIIVWKGAEWIPPRGHYVIHNADGAIGDYWHKDTNTFYTMHGKRRGKDAAGKLMEIELNQDEMQHIYPILMTVYPRLAQSKE